jgi:hypothetical protein
MFFNIYKHWQKNSIFETKRQLIYGYKKQIIEKHHQWQKNLQKQKNKAEDTQKLNDIITQRCIHGIYIFGHCPELKIPNKEITIINTNAQDLIFHILRAAVRYTHDKEMIQRKSGNSGLVDVLTMDTLKLLDQIKALL